MKLLTKIFSFFSSVAHAEAGAQAADDFFRSMLRKKQEINMCGTAFYVDVEMATLYPELHTLVFNTESMDATERQYWFDIMFTMTSEQIDELFEILETEKVKLAELEERYQSEIRSLNEKHLVEWQEFQAMQSRGSICRSCDAPVREGEKECDSCDPKPDDVKRAMELIASL